MRGKIPQSSIEILTPGGEPIGDDADRALRVKLVIDELFRVYVNQKSPRAAADGVALPIKGSKRGEACMLDFYTAMALEGRGYQVMAGTITTHLTGDVEITDTAAEMCADARFGITIIPVYLNIHIEALGGTLPILTAKSVGALSTAGTQFVPLPLMIGGRASLAIARVNAAGGCTVASETIIPTRRHYSATVGDVDTVEWVPILPPILCGPATFYVQVAATGTGPNYYAHFEFIELPTAAVD